MSKKTYNAYRLRTLTQYIADDTEHDITRTIVPCPCGNVVVLNSFNEYRSACTHCGRTHCGRTYRWIELIEVIEHQ